VKEGKREKWQQVRESIKTDVVIMKNQPPTPNPQPLTAVILAGGKSSRMGQPKALLPFAGEPLIAHTVRTLRRLFSDIVVVAAPKQELPSLSVTLVRDEVAYRGPVGGILYGLRAARAEIAFVTSCDAPFLNLELIAFLVTQLSGHDVVVPYWQERLQPLHAVYRRSVAPLLQEQLDRGELRPIFLYKKVRTREVRPEEIRRFDPEGLSFRNMNSPEDYQAALDLWQKNRQKGEGETGRQIETETDPFRPLSLSNLHLVFELFGVARLKAKTATVPLVLPEGAELRDAFAALAEAVPALVGPVLTVDRHALVNGYTCNVNGTEFTRDWHHPLRSGDHLLILSSDAGG
jgi:molybdopterin-guanine dinucleotide biosynthesis protein A